MIGWWAMPTILQGGDPAQIERFALPTLRGELTWCQLFSEPGAGSDLASLTTSAVREEGRWRLVGQKVWNSMAVEADWAICLARTDKDAPKHKGITYLLVDMRSPGIDVRPLREIAGETLFNEVFLDGVFLPDDCVVGEVNDGWRRCWRTGHCSPASWAASPDPSLPSRRSSGCGNARLRPSSNSNWPATPDSSRAPSCASS